MKVLELHSLNFNSKPLAIRITTDNGIFDTDLNYLKAKGIKPLKMTGRKELMEWESGGDILYVTKDEIEGNFFVQYLGTSALKEEVFVALSQYSKDKPQRVPLINCLHLAEKVTGKKLHHQRLDIYGSFDKHGKQERVSLFLKKGVKADKFEIRDKTTEYFFVYDIDGNLITDSVFSIIFDDDLKEAGFFSMTGIQNGVFTVFGYDKPFTDEDILFLIDDIKKSEK